MACHGDLYDALVAAAVALARNAIQPDFTLVDRTESGAWVVVLEAPSKGIGGAGMRIARDDFYRPRPRDPKPRLSKGEVDRAYAMARASNMCSEVVTAVESCLRARGAHYATFRGSELLALECVTFRPHAAPQTVLTPADAEVDVAGLHGATGPVPMRFTTLRDEDAPHVALRVTTTQGSVFVDLTAQQYDGALPPLHVGAALPAAFGPVLASAPLTPFSSLFFGRWTEHATPALPALVEAMLACDGRVPLQGAA
jgi:hypothetical protein